MEELQIIQNKIYEVRGQKVMLDRDLAELYGVTTGNLNKAVKRNIERFPEQFMFQLTEKEILMFQNGISSWGGTRKLPFVFTESGVSMLSAVLKSPTAVKVCITIMDAFVTLRNQLSNNSGVTAELERTYGAQLEALEKKLEAQHEMLVRQLSEVPELKLQQEVLMRRLCEQNAKFEQQQTSLGKNFERQLNKVKSELVSMDRQYFSLLDRQLFWESQQPREDHFAPPLYLDMATWVDEYSPKAVVIFTVRKDDRFLLKGIGARFNPWLTHQGRKCAGWIFPKSQISKLVEILPQGYDMRILKKACGDAEFVDKICKGKKK